MFMQFSFAFIAATYGKFFFREFMLNKPEAKFILMIVEGYGYIRISPGYLCFII